MMSTFSQSQRLGGDPDQEPHRRLGRARLGDVRHLRGRLHRHVRDRQVGLPRPRGDLSRSRSASSPRRPRRPIPVDYSHFNIMGTAVGAHGIEADSDKAIFPAVNLEVALRPRQGHQVPLPVDHPGHRLDRTSPRTTGRGWPSARPWPAPA